MAKSYPDLWQKYSEVHTEAGSAENKLGDCKVLLEKVRYFTQIVLLVAKSL
jgi:tRNA ligase